MVNQEHKNRYFTEGEVRFSLYNGEFSRFYENHKRLCDQITGLKIKSLSTPFGNKTILISQENFLEGIQTLKGFFSDVKQYIEQIPRKIIEEKINILKDNYLSDENYKNLISKKDNISVMRRLDRDGIYIKYLRECLKLADEIFENLQKSIALTTTDIVKMIRYENFHDFYSQLAKYRDEMIDSISHFEYRTMLDNINKVMGYYYTYRYLVGKREKFWIDELLDVLFNYYSDEDTIKMIIKIEDNNVSKSEELELRQMSVVLTQAIETIYFLCNSSLSQKNILIKTSEKVLIDKSLV